MLLRNQEQRVSDIPMYSQSWCNEDEEEKAPLGKGQYGMVMKGEIPAQGSRPAQKIAVKRICHNKDYDASKLLREISAQHRANHSAVLKICGWYADAPRGYYYIAMEYAYGDLEKALGEYFIGRPKVWRDEDDREVQWNATKMAISTLGIAVGMAACHKNKVTHRDLKPANVLLDSQMYPKICDFGMSKVYDHQTDHTVVNIGSPLWTPPEVFAEIRDHDPQKVDVYSYGMILYEMVTGRKPFPPTITEFDLKKRVMNGERPTWNGLSVDVDDDVKDLIERCLDHDPNRRPTFKELINEENREILKLPFTEGVFDDDEYDTYAEKVLKEFERA